jgi:hypothetical protein
MTENLESAVSDTDIRGAYTSASRHHQDRSLPRSLLPPRPRTSLGRATPTHSFFWVPMIHTVLQCMERGLTSSSDLAQYKKVALNPACCLCYGTLPAVAAAVGGEDPWVNIVRTYVADLGRRGITRRSFEIWDVNGYIRAESQEHHMYNATAHAPGTSAGASLVSDHFLATGRPVEPGSAHLRSLAGAVLIK